MIKLITLTRTLIILILALTCATLHAQSVIVKGTDAGAVHAADAGSVRGQIDWNFSDGRFTLVSTNQDVVIDNDSGLMWARDANIDGQKDWATAITYCSNLTNATYSDWRLPSITELSRDVTYGSSTGLVDAAGTTNDPALPPGHPFINILTNIGGTFYWSSTTPESGRAWLVELDNGDVHNADQVNAVYVWPCRGP